VPIFKEMDPEEALRAIEGHEDVLRPEAARLDAFYRTFKCPRCKAPLQKELDSRHAFADQSLMTARSLLRCSNCRYLIDPHSNIIIEYGDVSKIPVESIPILKTE
jgi:RNase P subunit RPR2